jgi:hypothetical protein
MPCCVMSCCEECRATDVHSLLHDTTSISEARISSIGLMSRYSCVHTHSVHRDLIHDGGIAPKVICAKFAIIMSKKQGFLLFF